MNDFDNPYNREAINAQIIDHFYHGTELPNDYDEYLEWLGIDNGLSTEISYDELIALRLKDIADHYFSDSVIFDYIDESYFFSPELLKLYENADEKCITDELRVRFARERISDAIESEWCDDNPQLRCFRIKQPDGLSLQICAAIEMHGQGGPHYDWLGIFKDVNDFIQKLNRYDLWPEDRIDEIDDKFFLSLWRK